MELRDIMIDYNENDYYKPEMRRKFTFNGHTYECEPNYAYLNSRLDGIFSKPFIFLFIIFFHVVFLICKVNFS